MMRRLIGVFLVTLALNSSLAAQAARPGTDPKADSAAVAAGLRYHAGALHRFFFGAHYRDLWTTPVRVPLLDLATYAGGLTPTTAGGRLQSRSLRFRATDGRQFAFRLIDKNPINALPEDLRQTVAADILQDQTSAGHPAAPLIVGPLLDAVGVLHADLHFVVLRDEPVLGAFRDEFVGKLGTFEQRILSPRGGERGFAGATRIVDSDTLFALMARDPREQVDAKRLLTARIMDLYIGDADRHRGQWTWAKTGTAPEDRWLPIPEDRDQALIRYDGFFLMLVRSYYPEVMNLGDRYGRLIGATRAGSELDRKLLSGLERPVWDSIGASVRNAITDSIIDHAVAQMPREYFPRDSARLAQVLKHRRDRIPEITRAFYEHVNHEADIHTTDAAEQVSIERRPDGSLDVRVVAGTAETPVLSRRYYPAETSDLRMYLHGGNDRVTVTGNGPSRITLRIIGGGGDDVLLDSAGHTRFYDDSGTNQALGRTTRIDRRPYTRLDKASGAPTPSLRDFGSEWRGAPWFTYNPDLGLFLGASASRYDYGFRKAPYASRLTLKAGYATKAAAVRTELNLDVRRQNSRTHTTFFTRASQLEILKFYGFGNDVPAPLAKDAYKVSQQQLVIHWALAFPLGPKLDAGIGPVLRYARTNLQPGQVISLTRPYGAEGFGTHEGFGQVGGRAWVRWDARDRPIAASRGVEFSAEGNLYPAAWDVRSTFGEVHADAATYFTAHIPLQPTLAFRAGAKKVWGAYPFYEAAFIGGAGTVRGLPLQRFAGDAAVSGSTELRLFLAKVTLPIPADFGIFGLADVGRVYLRGETSSTWHSGFGGGIWLAYLGRGNTLSLAVARSEQQTGVYFGTGFGF